MSTASPAARAGAPRWSVRTLLLALVLACLLPGAIGAGLFFYDDYRSGRARLERDIRQTARALVQAVDSQLAKSEVAALSLATSSHLARGDLAAFHRQARELLRVAKVGTNVVLSDASGQQRVNTLRDFGEPLPRHGNPEQLGRVFATAQPVVSDIYIGGVARRPVMSIDVPVRVAGKVAYDLSIGIFPEQFNGILSSQGLPPDWVVGIFDRNGTIAARSHAPEQFVGQKGSPELVSRLLAGDEGSLDSITRDGIPVLSVFSRSPQSHWSVAIGLPQQNLEAELSRAISRLALGFAGLFAISATLAWFMARRIARAVRALVAPAQALGSGEPVAIPELDVREADDLARAIEDAAGLLGQRTQALRELNASLEQRVGQRTQELTAANHELDAFAYAVSHDLRAPLRALSGFSQALMEDYGDRLDGEAKVYLEQIDIASRSMGDLVDGILALSRSTRGELHRDAIDLSALAGRLLAELARGEPQRQVAWEVAAGLTAEGDARMIEAALRNLLDNAWKYTAKTPAARIRVFAGELEGRPGFCIADNGAGFAMSHANRLFKPFQRLHRQDEFPGLGIGLATVQRIVHRHGGEIRAEGVPGGGATICFSLPGADGGAGAESG